MIIDEFVNIKPNSTTISYYKNLGYDVKIKETFKVMVKDLTPKSHALIKYKCDYCGKIQNKEYYLILKGRTKIQKDCCNNCKYLKEQEICFLENGVNSVLALEETKKKVKNTMLQKYGVEYPCQNKEIKEKVKNTNIKKYGVDNPIKAPEIKNKIRKTCLEKYGDGNVLGKNSILRGNIEIKSLESKFKNNSFPVSKSQEYLNDLYNGKINYLIGYYAVDILLENNVYCEYDGSGHKLNIQHGNITQKDFDDKQRKRYFYLKHHGYKLFRIINEKSKDRLPDKEILLKIKELSLTYLANENCNFIIFNFDEGFIKTKFFTLTFDFYNYNNVEELEYSFKNCLLEITQIGKNPKWNN